MYIDWGYYVIFFCVNFSVPHNCNCLLFGIDLIVLYSVPFNSHCLTLQVSLLLKKGPEPRIVVPGGSHYSRKIQNDHIQHKNKINGNV
jgi:hypothetical protein